MIRRVDNVTVEANARHPWTKRVSLSLHIGRATLPLGRRLRSEVETMMLTSRSFPVFYGQMRPKSYWRYKGRFFVDNDRLDVEDIHALLATRDRRQEMQIQSAKAFLQGGMPHRSGIPRGDHWCRWRDNASLHQATITTRGVVSTHGGEWRQGTYLQQRTLISSLELERLTRCADSS